jgi:hypothetical protein
VYTHSKPSTREELIQRIKNSFEELKTEVNLQWQDSLRKRVTLCIQERGGIFENKL